MLSLKTTFAALSLLIFISACETKPLLIDDQAIANENNTSDWLAYGRTHSEQRFSPITDIDEDNIENLKVDWYFDLPNDVGLVSTPLVVNGVMFFTGTMNIVKAVDAITGKLIWEYDPKVREAIKGKRQVGWKHNRGLSFYNDKVYAATWDGRLLALDSETGNLVWSQTTFPPNKPLYITGAPKAFAGKVLIGNGGSEEGPNRGFVTAYDAETGKEAWKFHIVPGNPAEGFESEAMEMAAKTWSGDWWRHGGGGNAWHGFTYDAELDVLYIGTGNGSPWNARIRSPEGGDNLFLCSIVALNPHSGEYLWHYQTTPGETWDYNSTMDIILADITVNEKPIKAILHAPKNGFFYVIDRVTGKLISAEPFVETTWATHIDLASGKPVETANARFQKGPVNIAPNSWGGHSWHAMSFNPKTGLVYIPALHQSEEYHDEGVDYKTFQAKDFDGGIGVRLSKTKKQPKEYPASLIAWDPVAQKPKWEIPQNEFWNAGTLTTAGNLVFQGKANGNLKAYNATTGEEVWNYHLGLGVSAPPITYKIDGRQYISILVGFGGGYSRGGLEAYKLGWSYRTHTRRLVTFSLEGKAVLPPLSEPHYPKPLFDTTFVINKTLAQKGYNEYWKCFNCHGENMYGGGMAPDLRASPIPLSAEAFKAVVKSGSLTNNGMPAFPDYTDEQLESLRHFIRQKAHESYFEYDELMAKINAKAQ